MNNPRDLFSSFSKKNKKNEEKRCHFDNPWLMARNWYASELGQALYDVEKQSLDKLLEHIFGYNLVQLGCLKTEAKNNSLISNSRISSQFVLESLAQPDQLNSGSCINTRFDELPIQNQSIDAIILPHTLEFEQNPHQILREVERVLVAEGKAIFLGFNPTSLWGFWHKYWEMKDRIADKNSTKGNEDIPLPSCGHLIGQKRLRDWMQLLGFDIDLVKEYFYRPPLQNSVLLKKLEFIERAGQLSKILPAGGYIMVASKRVSTLTPIPQGWKLAKTFISPEASQPSAGFKNTNIKKD